MDSFGPQPIHTLPFPDQSRERSSSVHWTQGSVVTGEDVNF
jgi:hypothetical protein